jgi:hypothetical protein
MTAMHSILPTLLVAIDISQHRHEVAIRIPSQTRHRRWSAMNALEDFQRSSAVLASYGLGIRYAAGWGHPPHQLTPSSGFRRRRT